MIEENQQHHLCVNEYESESIISIHTHTTEDNADYIKHKQNMQSQ